MLHGITGSELTHNHMGSFPLQDQWKELQSEYARQQPDLDGATKGAGESLGGLSWEATDLAADRCINECYAGFCLA